MLCLFFKPRPLPITNPMSSFGTLQPVGSIGDETDNKETTQRREKATKYEEKRKAKGKGSKKMERQ